MKVLLTLTFLMFLSTTYAEERKYVGDYVCKATKFVQQGDTEKNADVDARIEFQEYTVAEVQEIREVVGHIWIKDNGGGDYYGVFSFDKQVENLKYRPLKYKNHTQYKNFDATKTNNNDGGGMWGQFVVNKTRGGTFDANYIFKSGDHMGGVVVFECKVAE